MDTSLLIYLVLAIIIIILVFTIVKKVVKAIVAIIIVFILIIVAAAGLVYLDYNSLVGQDNYDLEFTLVEGDSPFMGVSLTVENGTLDVESIKGIDNSKLNSEYIESITSDDGVFLLTIDKDWYFSLLESKSEFVLPLDQDRTLSSQEVIEIIEGQEDPRVILLDAIFNNEDLEEDERATAELNALNDINEVLDEYGSSASELVFAASLLEILDDRMQVIEFANGIKGEEVEIYPERFSFRLFKFLLPSDIVSSLFPEEQNS